MTDRLARIRRLAERRRRWRGRIPFVAAAWPTHAALAAMNAPAVRDTVRQAAHGARYDGLGSEWWRRADDALRTV